MANALSLLHRLVEIDQHSEPLRRKVNTEACYSRSLISRLVAPECVPERSHDSGRQYNAAVDIGLKSPVLVMTEPRYVNLSTNLISLLQICSDGGDGTSPNFMILVLAQLVLRPSLHASVSEETFSADPKKENISSVITTACDCAKRQVLHTNQNHYPLLQHICEQREAPFVVGGLLREQHLQSIAATVAEWVRAWDTLTMFAATVCGRS